jgi:chemotaxis protein MotB
MALENQVSPNAKAGEDGRGDAKEMSRQDVSEENRSETHSDEHLFANPYAVLSEIAEETGLQQNVSTRGDGGIQTSGPSTGAHGGEAYRDPFAPDFWSQQVSGGDTAEGVKPPDTRVPASDGEPPPPNAAAPADAAPLEPLAKAEPKPEDAAKQEENAEREEAGPSKATLEAADAIREKISQSLGSDSKLAEGLTVVAGEDGVTISVTDQFDFGMFEVGSAVPRRDLVLAMEKIGKILAGQKGALAIQGHTDARPFRSATYDNWRLSTARAHSAYYMLVRGGLDENRITTVAGHAARKLRDTADPLAASNRRIEILLDVGG